MVDSKILFNTLLLFTLYFSASATRTKEEEGLKKFEEIYAGNEKGIGFIVLNTTLMTQRAQENIARKDKCERMKGRTQLNVTTIVILDNTTILNERLSHLLCSISKCSSSLLFYSFSYRMTSHCQSLATIRSSLLVPSIVFIHISHDSLSFCRPVTWGRIPSLVQIRVKKTGMRVFVGGRGGMIDTYSSFNSSYSHIVMYNMMYLAFQSTRMAMNEVNGPIWQMNNNAHKSFPQYVVENSKRIHELYPHDKMDWIIILSSCPLVLFAIAVTMVILMNPLKAFFYDEYEIVQLDSDGQQDKKVVKKKNKRPDQTQRSEKKECSERTANSLPRLWMKRRPLKRKQKDSYSELSSKADTQSTNEGDHSTKTASTISTKRTNANRMKGILRNLKTNGSKHRNGIEGEADKTANEMEIARLVSEEWNGEVTAISEDKTQREASHKREGSRKDLSMTLGDNHPTSAFISPHQSKSTKPTMSANRTIQKPTKRSC